MVRQRLEMIQLEDDQELEVPLESSPDSTYRVVVMAITLAPLLVLGITTISYLAILN